MATDPTVAAFQVAIGSAYDAIRAGTLGPPETAGTAENWLLAARTLRAGLPLSSTGAGTSVTWDASLASLQADIASAKAAQALRAGRGRMIQTRCRHSW